MEQYQQDPASDDIGNKPVSNQDSTHKQLQRIRSLEIQCEQQRLDIDRLERNLKKISNEVRLAVNAFNLRNGKSRG